MRRLFSTAAVLALTACPPATAPDGGTGGGSAATGGGTAATGGGITGTGGGTGATGGGSAATGGGTAATGGGSSAGGTGGASGGVTGVFYKSGTRLRAQVFRAGDATVFETFVDTMRSNESCNFRRTSGTAGWRCIPNAVTLAYLDAQCSPGMEAAVLDTCTASYRYAFNVTVSECEQTVAVSSVRAIATELMGTTTVYYSSNGSCFGSPVTAGKRVYSVGAPIPFVQFATGTERFEESGGVGRTRLIGDDTSELVLTETLVDVARDAGCIATELTNRCAPRTPSSSSPNDYADMACTQRAAHTTCLSPVARRLELGDAGTCTAPDLRLSFWQIGAPVDGGFYLAGTTCAPSAGVYQPLVAEIPLTTFPAAPQVDVGSGRLKARVLTAGGAQLEPGYLWDSTLSAACSPKVFGDAGTFCLPPHFVNPALFQFKDAACTQPIVRFDCRSLAKVVVTGNSTCPQETYDVTVRRLSAPFPLTRYFSNSAGPCNPIDTLGGYAQDVLSPGPVGTTLAPASVVIE